MQLTQPNIRQNAGFTMVELMIGLIVFSILIGIFALASNSMTSQARLSSAVRDTIGLLHYARTRAANNMRTYRMQFCVAKGSCTVENKTLTDYEIKNPIPRGLLFLEQCPSSRIDGRPCGDPGQSHELKYYNLERSFRDVEFSSLMIKGDSSSSATLMLYFRTDGSIASCTSSGTGIPTCTDSVYYICLRTSLDIAGSQATYIPRRIEVSSDGRIKSHVDTQQLCK
jgi:prepilin-type N-terminal cleavage/methylation domain-containing protein